MDHFVYRVAVMHHNKLHSESEEGKHDGKRSLFGPKKMAKNRLVATAKSR